MNTKEYPIGKIIEKEFIDVMLRLNPRAIIKFPTRDEDMKGHWDVEIDGIRYDVKSIKKQSRHDAFPNENFHWIELQNVNGDKGSLYGDAHSFAFELIDYWVIVEKIPLQNFINKMTKEKELETSKDPYTLYQRKGRKDIIVKVKTLDLIYILLEIKKKNND